MVCEGNRKSIRNLCVAGVVINVNKRYYNWTLSRDYSSENYLFVFFLLYQAGCHTSRERFSTTKREKRAKWWLVTSNGKRAGRVTGQNGWHRGIKTCRMDVGDLSGPAGLVGSGSISVATGVGIIANTTSATPGWWTPTSTITSAAANTDVVSLLFFFWLSVCAEVRL